MKKAGIVIAGTNSGCGKTTLTAGILAALVKRGLKVQPYKVGPDFIDPMFHTKITGRYSRNLDSWLLDDGTLKYLYNKSARDAEITVIEGVMGLYDGFGGRNDPGSTAYTAKLLGLPLILVINPEGMALSAAALVKGFMDFDSELPIKGVILNNVDFEDYFRLLKKYIEENTQARVLGYLRRQECYSLGERHLGLVTAAEIEGFKGKIELLAEQVEETINIKELLDISEQARELDVSPETPINAVSEPKVRIAVAYDKAFCFYYRDNLELLETLGAELVYFSPLEDARFPEKIDGLYMGGGYPELWAAQLEGNKEMRFNIKLKIEEGIPAYAECGGLMYLSRNIQGMDGKPFEMVGAIPGSSKMTKGLRHFGYVDIEVKEDNALAEKGSAIKGHEFHFSETVFDASAETCYRLTQKRPGTDPVSWYCGCKYKNLLAGYAHLHFWSNPAFAVNFVDKCRQWKRKGLSV